MIIVNLSGGLGNQMFQYALGRRLSVKYDVPLRFDTYFFDDVNNRTPTLFNHTIAGERLTEKDLTETLRYPAISRWLREGKELLPTPAGGIKSNLYYIPRFFPKFAAKKFNYYREKLEQDRFVTRDWAYRRQYHPEIMECGKNAYLYGHWQSAKYFEEISETIKDDLSISDPLPESNRKYEDLILQETSVSIHIRRGDKLDGRSNSAVPVNYFEKAVEHIVHKTDNPSFFVFSDDIEWAKNNLEFEYPCEFISENDEKTDYFDMHLMKSCDHNIIANSTFSWWGAYLNDNKNKIVTVPDPWKGTKWPNHQIRDTDLIPNEWTLLNYTE